MKMTSGIAKQRNTMNTTTTIPPPSPSPLGMTIETILALVIVLIVSSVAKNERLATHATVVKKIEAR